MIFLRTSYLLIDGGSGNFALSFLVRFFLRTFFLTDFVSLLFTFARRVQSL